MPKFTFLLVTMYFFTGNLAAQQAVTELSAQPIVSYKSPLTFSAEVDNLLLRDQHKNIAPHGVVITGSSSVRFWHSIHRDFTQFDVIARGFGGSNMNDLVHFYEQLITQYKPRAVAIYEGDNDIAQGISPQQIVSKFIELNNKIRAVLPEIRIYFIAIKPSITRQKMWPKMAETNQLIQALCQRKKICTYIDVASSLLNNGTIRQDIFIADGLHLNEKGYQLWSQAIVPVIERVENP